VAPPIDAADRWRRHATRIVALAWLLGLSTILPWFARNTILPAGDGHLEILNAWTNGRAVAPTGDGWAGPLRVVPWGALFVAVAAAGVIGATLAKRRSPGDPAARLPVLICLGSAGLGLLMVALAWIGAATGVDTDVIPMFGAVIAALVLAGWLAIAVAMLRAQRSATSEPGARPRGART
jgi:hypothetical protein